MEMLDHLHLEDPSAGVRRMQGYLHRMTGFWPRRMRVRRLMRLMGNHYRLKVNFSKIRLEQFGQFISLHC